MSSGLKGTGKILLGQIHGLFGVKGWVKVFSYTRPRSQILNYARWYLGRDADCEIKLENGRSHNDGVIAKLAGIDDRDQAVSLLEKEIWVEQDDLPKLTADEYYWYQLIGLQVFDTSKNTIGTLVRLMETGANDVMVVRDEKGAEHLIPYVMRQVIKKVNLDNKTMIVDWDIEY